MASQQRKKSYLTVTIDSAIKTLPLTKKELTLWSEVSGSFLKERLSFTEAELSINFCGISKIKALNSKFRKKNTPTDVLSFAYIDFNKEKKLAPFIHLGEIYICVDIAKVQAKEFKITYKDEVYHLLTHGLFHLLGFDHELGAKEEKEMMAFEDKFLNRLSKKIKSKK